MKTIICIWALIGAAVMVGVTAGIIVTITTAILEHVKSKDKEL